MIAAAALVLSTVMAVIYFLFSLCGGAGAHICCAAVPLGCAPGSLQREASSHRPWWQERAARCPALPFLPSPCP